MPYNDCVLVRINIPVLWRSLQTAWLSDEQIRCTTPPGVGARLPVVVTVGSQTSIAASNTTGPTTYSYRSPTVASIFPSYAFFSAPGRTSQLSFSISGNDLGLEQSIDRVSVSIGGLLCGTVSVSSDAQQLTCSDIQADLWNKSLVSGDVRVNVGGQIVTSVAAVDFIGPPTISSISPVTGSAGSTMTIRGNGFGRVPADVLAVSIGNVTVSFVSQCVTG